MVIELGGVQFGLKSYEWFQSAQREFDLKLQVWFQTKIARHQVQLPLYYSHFEIAEFNQYQYFIERAKLGKFTDLYGGGGGELWGLPTNHFQTGQFY